MRAVLDNKYDFKQIATGIIVPALVVLIGLGSYFVFLPKYRELRQAREILKTNQEAVASSRAAMDQVQALVQEYADKRGELQVLDEALPSAPRIPELLANLEYLAGQSGILIAELKLTPAPTLATAAPGTSLSGITSLESVLAAAEGVSAMHVELALTGQYVNLKTFLLNLEQNLRLLDVLELTLGEVDSDSAFQEYVIKMRTYYQQE